MGRHQDRSSYAWKQVRAKVLDGARACHLCGGELDFDAPARSRLAPSVDHVLSLKAMRDLDPETRKRLMFDPENLRPAHYGCNSSRGARRRRSAVREVGSREW